MMRIPTTMPKGLNYIPKNAFKYYTRPIKSFVILSLN